MQVFISYAFDEPAAVLTGLISALDARKIRYWHHDSLAAGEPLVKELRRAIAKSAVCIFVATRKSTRSDWCRSEIGAFWGVGIPVIVYFPSGRAKASDLPPQIQDSVFTTDVRSVVEAVAKHLAAKHFPVTGQGRDMPEFGQADEAFSKRLPNVYEIPRGTFTINAGIIRIDVQLDARTPNGDLETCQMTGSGRLRKTFATIEYSLTKGRKTVWGGVLCLEYPQFAATYRGYFLTHHAWDPSHFAFGVLEFTRATSARSRAKLRSEV